MITTHARTDIRIRRVCEFYCRKKERTGRRWRERNGGETRMKRESVCKESVYSECAQSVCIPRIHGECVYKYRCWPMLKYN